MKRMIRIVLIAAVATGASFVVHQTSNAQGTPQVPDKAQATQAGTQQGLEATVNGFLDAVKAKDAAKLKASYTPDYTFTDPDGKMMTADERLKVMASPEAGTSDSFSDIKARIYGTTGVVTGLGTGKTSSGTPTSTRFTQVWTWQNGRWMLAASHVSRVK
jgi:ketosteroid isomerase-like protein